MTNSNDKNENDLLLEHDYDGIQEFDYPLPRWWLWTFYITIFFAVIYAGYYMTVGPTLRDELKVAMAEIEAKRPKAVAGSHQDSDEVLNAVVKNPDKLSQGKTVYAGKCAACHGQNAEGSIGPNLTDDFWIHGKGVPTDIAKVIRDGVSEKGMPPWGAILKEDELYSLVAFIKSVNGSKPANGKEPQGQKVEEL